jgi:hypothetical protein
VLFVTLEL